MEKKEQIDINTLSLPDELIKWIDNAPIYESSGKSGARTVYIDRDGGAYLKIAVCGSLLLSSQMQTYFSKHKLTSPVLRYLSTDRDYMVTAPIKGDDGTSSVANIKETSSVQTPEENNIKSSAFPEVKEKIADSGISKSYKRMDMSL